MHPDVVIVGAGITGSFAAYYLAGAGFRTALVDRDGIGSHASGVNPGGLNPLHGPGIPGPLGDLAMESFRLHEEAWEVLPEYSRTGFSPRIVFRIQLLRPGDDGREVGRVIDLYASATGFSAVRIDRRGLNGFVPGLHPDFTGGVLTYGNGCVEGRAYTKAVAEAALASGAELVEGTIAGIEREGSRAVAVRFAEGGVLRCGAVVVSTGPWTDAARWLGVEIPVTPVKGQLLLVRVPGDLTYDLTRGLVGFYSLPGGHRAWLGGTEEHVGFDHVPDATGRETLLRGAAGVLDRGELEVLDHVAALRPVTPDGLPIVGAAPGWENVFLATGAGRKGMLLSAGMARATADLVLEGSTSLPVGPCSPLRFRESARVEDRVR